MKTKLKKGQTKEDVRVFVAEGSRMPQNENIIHAARYIGEFLGKEKYAYLQGCSDRGLMGETYKEFIKYNDKVKLVDMPVVFLDNYHKGMVGDYIPSDCLNTRLKVFADNTDIIVILPGANGTLHEFSTFYELNRMYPGTYEIIIVNVDGYFDHLIKFLKMHEKIGLARYKGEFDKHVKVVSSSEEAAEIISKYEKKPVESGVETHKKV